MRIKRLGVGVGMDRPWEPRDIPNISGHWDVGDSSTHTITAGRMAALADKSGLGRNLTEVGGSGPTYEAAGFNGRPSMVFDGAADYIVADAVAADFTGADQPLTIIMTGQVVSHAASDALWSLGDAASAVQLMSVTTDGANLDINRTDDAALAKSGAGAVPFTDRRIFSATFSGTAGSSYIDGTRDVNAADLDVAACTFDQFTIGCLRQNANANFGNVRVCEVIVYARELSDAERQRAEAYLEAKWFNPGEVPLRVSGLSGWWDASHTSTLTLSGSDVDQWDDKSGLGRNFTATVPPEYEAAGWNGLPSILFNGVDEFMIADAVAADFTGTDKPMTVIMAVQAVSRTAGDYLWSMGESGSAVHWYGMHDDGTNIDTRREDDGGVAKTAVGGVATSTDRFILSQVFNGTTVDTFYNAVADVSAGDLDVGACTHNTFTLGCLRRAINTGFANIRIVEWVVHKRALPAAERLKIESYLINKWSVS